MKRIDAAQPRLLDAGELSQCQRETIKGALCLPASTFIAADGSVASFYHVGWALGTLGLDSSETVLVFADKPADAHLLAGVLYLVGQQAVWVWQGDTITLRERFGSGPGVTRGIVRQRVYRGVVRDRVLISHAEVDGLVAQGWQVHSAPGEHDSVDLVIIAGSKPSESIMRFVELMPTSTTSAKLVIDAQARFPTNNGVAIVLAGLALLLFAAGMISLKRRRGQVPQ